MPHVTTGTWRLLQSERTTLPRAKHIVTHLVPCYLKASGSSKRESTRCVQRSLWTRGRGLRSGFAGQIPNWSGQMMVRWISKIPVDKGAWPAFWVRGADTKLEWPNDGEVDIMEYYRHKDWPKGKVLANFIYGKDWQSVMYNSKTFEVDQSWADQFHVWALEWDTEEMRIAVDGKLVNSMRVAEADLQGLVNPWREFEVYLMVNLAIGGQNGGPVDDTVFPLHLYVDNISFYEETPDTSLVVM